MQWCRPIWKVAKHIFAGSIKIISIKLSGKWIRNFALRRSEVSNHLGVSDLVSKNLFLEISEFREIEQPLSYSSQPGGESATWPYYLAIFEIRTCLNYNMCIPYIEGKGREKKRGRGKCRISNVLFRC